MVMNGPQSSAQLRYKLTEAFEVSRELLDKLTEAFEVSREFLDKLTGF